MSIMSYLWRLEFHLIWTRPFKGVETARHSATLSLGTPGVLHGVRTYLLQSKTGQIMETHSISAGLDYPVRGVQ